MLYTTSERWYVYVDRTGEGEPYYVGKGIASRLKSFKRNKKHAEVRQAYGLHREVLFETWDEQTAFDAEKEIIAYLETYPPAGIRCNMTCGGGTARIPFIGPLRSDDYYDDVFEAMFNDEMNEGHGKKKVEQIQVWITPANVTNLGDDCSSERINYLLHLALRMKL